MEILRVENVTKQFTKHRALDNISLSVPTGSIYGLLGPNGAGKTTLIRIINRITAPDSGHVFLNGRELAPEDVFKIGYLPEERGLYKKMKVGEQAIYFAMLKGLSKQEATKRIKEWFVKFELQDWWGRKVEELSKGMAQKVQFIVTVLHKPQLLILDEPFSGFDPINTQIITDEILKLRDEGSTIIFSTHNMSSVEQLCDHITLINKAHNILSGSVNDIRHKHGNNIFQIDFIGDKSKLCEVISNGATIIEGSEEESIYDSIKFQLSKETNVSQVIDTINSQVEIRNFREIIPSMNDIFINAVNTAADRSKKDQL